MWSDFSRNWFPALWAKWIANFRSKCLFQKWIVVIESPRAKRNSRVAFLWFLLINPITSQQSFVFFGRVCGNKECGPEDREGAYQAFTINALVNEVIEAIKKWKIIFLELINPWNVISNIGCIVCICFAFQTVMLAIYRNGRLQNLISSVIASELYFWNFVLKFPKLIWCTLLK